MQCREVRALVLSERGGGASLTAEASEHVARCEACQALVADRRRLDDLLDADVDEPVRPGFDTRMFARLAEVRQRKRRGWRLTWLVAGALTSAAAAAALIVVIGTPTPPLGLEPSDVGLALNLELAEDLDLIEHLDEVEAYDTLAQVDTATLRRLVGGEGRHE